MYIMLIIGLLYVFLICVDLIPMIKKKEKKALFLSIPVYMLTLAVNVMVGLGINLPPFNDMITQMIKSIFHMQ
jgi:hypothetical protein